MFWRITPNNAKGHGCGCGCTGSIEVNRQARNLPRWALAQIGADSDREATEILATSTTEALARVGVVRLEARPRKPVGSRK